MSAPTLTRAQQDEVIAATDAWLEFARQRVAWTLSSVAVQFDLQGLAAGQYRLQQGRAWIRYNAPLFARHYAENLAETVPHEVAHHVVAACPGRQSEPPHGRSWQRVMQSFGLEPRACHRFSDFEGLPVRRQRRHSYLCACGPQWLTTVRHNRVLRGDAQYACRQCGELLRSVAPPGLEGQVGAPV